MKIYEIEQGEKQSIPYHGIDRIIDVLNTECSESVQAMRSVEQFLYRGVKVGGSNIGSPWKPRHLQGSAPSIFKASSREDRKSMDTPNQIQNMIDGALKSSGFKALRSNSTFCSGYQAAAKNYGVPYLIFPINGFDFTWSMRFADLYSNFVEDLTINSSRMDEFMKSFEYDPEEWIFGVAKYNNSSLEAAIKSNHEIMIRGEYYAIHHQFEGVLKRFFF